MKKSLFFFAAAALALTACSNDDATQQAQATAAPQAVAFDIYTSGTTRAGDAGIQTTSTLQASGKGFGVFAVQSDNNVYAPTQTTNFMWNEHVTYSSSAWTYSPLKYWPNETDNDSQTPNAANAQSGNIDRLSFFAYAPYVAEKTSTYDGSLDGVAYSAGLTPTKSAHNASSGDGILGVSANNEATVDPFVWYKSALMPSNSVDLLWGVAPAGDLSYTSVASGLNNTAGVAQIAGGVVTVAEGMPLVDLIKPSKDQKIRFLFKHSLARLGVTVVAAIDQIAPGGELDANTKIAVESITIEDVTATSRLFTVGRLNLKNTTAGTSLWEETSGAPVTLTVNSSYELSDEIKWLSSASATVADAKFKGVDKTERYAIRTDGDQTKDVAYFMVIPSHEDTDLKVTITYHVFTKDDKVSGGYAITKNVIDKTITIPKLTNNKAYNLKVILGLTSVKLDAEVADWVIQGAIPVDLPRNNE